MIFNRDLAATLRTPRAAGLQDQNETKAVSKITKTERKMPNILNSQSNIQQDPLMCNNF